MQPLTTPQELPSTHHTYLDSRKQRFVFVGEELDASDEHMECLDPSTHTTAVIVQ